MFNEVMVYMIIKSLRKCGTWCALEQSSSVAGMCGYIFYRGAHEWRLQVFQCSNVWGMHHPAESWHIATWTFAAKELGYCDCSTSLLVQAVMPKSSVCRAVINLTVHNLISQLHWQMFFMHHLDHSIPLAERYVLGFCLELSILNKLAQSSFDTFSSWVLCQFFRSIVWNF